MNDKAYIAQLVKGDIHVVNQKAAGITPTKDMSARDIAKRFIYAWLLGAGDHKVGIIVGVSKEEYKELFDKAKKIQRYNRYTKHELDSRGLAILGDKDNLLWYTCDKLREEGRSADEHTVAQILKGFFTKRQFLESLPSLRRLKEYDIKGAANLGYMIGLDGRKIWVPSEHLAMGAYLQGFEAVVMKKAYLLAFTKLKSLGIPFGFCAIVHDEMQVECPPEEAQRVGKILSDSIAEAGESLGSRCPLVGEFRVGSSWGETH
jgi:hypothetical protein